MRICTMRGVRATVYEVNCVRGALSVNRYPLSGCGSVCGHANRGAAKTQRIREDLCVIASRGKTHMPRPRTRLSDNMSVPEIR